MGIIRRTRDIISSNINAALDKAEDPHKVVKMFIRDMEDALVELKSACAGAMATRNRIAVDQRRATDRLNNWAAKARLAVDKGRDDLAREALHEKRRLADHAEVLEQELADCDEVVQQYKSDIAQLEDKLKTVRERERVIVQRHRHARKKKQAQIHIRRVDTSDAMVRFEELEHRVVRMEAEADLVNYGRTPGLSDELDTLHHDEEIERELAELKDGAAVTA
jgi:phage shock protein A